MVVNRITDVVLEPHRLSFRVPLRYGDRERIGQDVVLVRVCTADGRTGVGEYLGAPSDLADRAATDRTRALGATIADAVEVDDWTLGAAMDTAVLDLAAQEAGRTMARLMADRHHLRPDGPARDVAVNALLTIGRDAPEVDAQRAQVSVAQGYRVIKLKPAIGTTAFQQHLVAIRAALGPAVALRLDLNGALPTQAAMDLLRRLDPIGLEYVEQPIAPDLGPAVLASVRAVVPMPVAADEAVVDLAALDALIATRACDVVVLKPSRLGGPHAALRLAGRAIEAGMGVTVSTMYESGIGLAAALQVAATLPGDRAHGLATGDLLVDDLTGGALRVEAGRLRVPERSGLGVSPAPRPMAEAGASA